MSTTIQSPQPVKPQAYNKTKIVWGIVCLTGPTVLLIISIVLYAFMNFLASNMSTVGPVGTGPLAELGMIEPAWKAPVNVILFLFGAVATISLLPGIVTGIILLATSKK